MFVLSRCRELGCDFCILAKLMATTSVAQSVERWSRDPELQAQFPAEGLGVVFFAAGPGWVF